MGSLSTSILVLVCDQKGRRGQQLAIDLDPAGFDHALGFPARSDARACEGFGNTIALVGYGGLICHRFLRKSIFMKFCMSSICANVWPKRKRQVRAASVPVGALIVDPQSGAVIAHTGNAPIGICDPTAHAEILASSGRGLYLG